MSGHASQPPLRDQFRRPLRDLRLSVTDRCNLRCRYCMPAEVFGPDHAFLPRHEILSYEEMLRFSRAAVEAGVSKIRLTGGEPLLRRDLDVLVAGLDRLRCLGLEDIALTSNGMLLPRQARRLRAAGLDRVTISLDALDPEVAARLSGNPASIQGALAGMDAALEAGLGLKVNTVLQRGVNEDQILPLAELAATRDIPIRFIEFMDTGEKVGWQRATAINSAEVLDALQLRWQLEPVAPERPGETATRHRRVGAPAEEGFEIGLISSISQPFCGSCNRLRLAADGQLFTCLFATAGHQVRAFLAEDADPRHLAAFLAHLWGARDDEYSRRRGTEAAARGPKPDMSYLGG